VLDVSSFKKELKRAVLVHRFFTCPIYSLLPNEHQNSRAYTYPLPHIPLTWKHAQE
jgi:hypothetical protein